MKIEVQGSPSDDEVAAIVAAIELVVAKTSEWHRRPRTAVHDLALRGPLVARRPSATALVTNCAQVRLSRSLTESVPAAECEAVTRALRALDLTTHPVADS